jgi:hypothetical protein
MTLADDRILEYLREEGTGTPTQISESGLVRFTRPYINERLSKLGTHGLVVNVGNGVYQITERGEAYLDGNVDTSEDRPDKPATGATATGDQNDEEPSVSENEPS